MAETNFPYHQLSKEIEEKMISDKETNWQNSYAFKDENAVRRDMERDKNSILRPAFARDVDKIMNVPYFTRYSDKTQVFSLNKNDDISRRSYHVQLVSKIARNIGRLLGLNLNLIEAIALGHDIGHTPFGHAGERKLSEIYNARTGKLFNHNIQSARVLDGIFSLNVSLQTLDGIICHNGELELKEYRPCAYSDFETFDSKMNACYERKDAIEELIPNTLEGCVVRISDILAYIGKDRQDAMRLGVISGDDMFSNTVGRTNAEILNNMTVNLVENSYGKSFLSMSDEFFEAISLAKKENYKQIYLLDKNNRVFDEQIFPMFEEMYEKLRKDLIDKNRESVVYTHHIDYVNSYRGHYASEEYEDNDIDDIVVDYIASMTDDYFVDLYRYLFPNGKYSVCYADYFETD